jgi:hypothetical protein
VADAPRTLDRHGNPYVSPAAPATSNGWVQLSGRTVHDQIVVFQGPESLTGSLLQVRVKEAHGMTIFADLLASAHTASPENLQPAY